MSIKVYTGKKLSGVKSFDEMQAFINHASDVITKKSAKLYKGVVAQHYTRKVDGIYHEFEKPEEKANKTIYSLVRDEIDKRQQEVLRTKSRDPEIDFDQTLNIYFYENEAYAFLATEHGEIQDAFEEIPGVEDYGYWNNVDPDETVSEKEWERRGDVWNKVLYEPNLTWTFAPMDLQVELYRTVAPDDIIKLLPSTEERIGYIARHLAYKEAAKQKEIKTSQEVMSLLLSDEYKASIKEFKTTLTKDDVFEITKDNLFKLRIGDLKATIVK